MAPSGPKADPKAKAAPKAAVKKVEKKVEEPRPEDLIEKVDPPKKEEFEEKMAAVQAGIDKLQNEQKELAKRIGERSGGKDEYQTKRAELRAELDHWSGLLDGIRGKKDGISKALGDKKTESMEAKNELTKMKKAVGFTSEVEIDDRIREIEFKMHHSSVSLKEEKAMMIEIASLKKNRPKVAGIKGMEGALASDDKGSSLRDQSKALSQEMGQMLEEKRKVSEKLKELNEQRKAETGDLPALIEEREALSGKIRELSATRQTIRAEQRAGEQAYYAYQAEVRKLRQERSAQERTERQADYEKSKRVREAEKLDEQPFTSEITLIEQTIAFCKTFNKEKDSGEKEEKKEIDHGKMDGIEVMVSKKDRDEDMYFVPTKGKKKKAKGEKADGASKPIKHSAETFQLFNQLSLNAPITTADIPDLLEKLEAKLAGYKTKVEEWKLKKDDLKKKILEGATEDEEKAEEKEEAKAEE